MKYEYKPNYAPYLTIYMDIEENTTITRIDHNGEWAGDHVEEILMDQHGDQYITEAEAEIRAQYEADRAEYIWENRRAS